MMNTTEYISEILRMEYGMTIAVLNGHKPHSDDMFKEDRIKLKIYRDIIKL